MSLFSVILVLFFLSLNAQETDSLTKKFPQTGDSPYSFIPKSWKIISQAEGDLNSDKKKDLVLVIESPNFKRLLLILWNKGKQFEIFQALSGVIPNKTKKTDPFSGISIQSGKLFIEQQGGETLSWKVTEVYQFRKDAFYLVTQKNIEINLRTNKIYEKELNFLKSTQTLKIFDKNGSLESQKITKLKKESLQKLTSKSN
ncbi:MAG: hypothetical protein N3A69_11190 [Leptospiraceae bacterium]|nr:hypothetical protein [Leptospiraceae bacterium]